MVTPDNALSVRAQNSSPEDTRPIGARLYLYRPYLVINVGYGFDASSNGTCQYPFLASNTAKHTELLGMRATMSFGAGNG